MVQVWLQENVLGSGPVGTEIMRELQTAGINKLKPLMDDLVLTFGQPMKVSINDIFQPSWGQVARVPRVPTCMLSWVRAHPHGGANAISIQIACFRRFLFSEVLPFWGPYPDEDYRVRLTAWQLTPVYFAEVNIQ